MGVSVTRIVKYILKGDKGDSAVNYYITLSAKTFAADSTGKPLNTTENISVTAYKQVGNNSAVVLSTANGDNWYIAAYIRKNESNVSNYVSSYDDKLYIPAPGYAFNEIGVTFSVKINGTPQVYQQEIIQPLKQGAQGNVGAALRGPQAWSDCATGYSFQAGGQGDTWKDVVIYGDNYYSCVKNHAKTATNYPGSTEDNNNGYWQLGDKIELVATKILLATYALVKNLGVEAIDMKDNNGNILFQAKDGNVICKTGTFENINISGIVRSKLFYGSVKQINTGTYAINPSEEPYNWYVISNPISGHYLILPQASLWDGLEINIITIMESSTFNIYNRTHIKSIDGDMQIKDSNIYNIFSNSILQASVEKMGLSFYQFSDYVTMSPNFQYRFKSINGKWYAIDGIWTGE